MAIIMKGVEGIKVEAIKIEDIKVEDVELNPIVEIRKKVEGSLIVERTPEMPVTEVKNYNITEIQKKIAKIDGVIKLWEDKKKPLQAILDEYKAMK